MDRYDRLKIATLLIRADGNWTLDFDTAQCQNPVHCTFTN